ncbi:MAG TPA: alanine--tRNA ligase-related protein [Candidatus Saccharimonadales bacterium]|nr:alanine--tRNA ligase-related protein [Candidatus Saccharimonadales bacterium]
MNNTILLYMQDFDVETCNASIVSAALTEDDRTDFVLDQTCFYARGGGQDWDEGVIKKGDAAFAVDEVRLDENGVVHHIGTITNGSFAKGDAVLCEVDHERRAINTRLHSAAHVIDMAIAQLGLDWVGAKGQHYPHLSAIEYSGAWEPEKAERLRAEIEALANQLITKGSHNTLRLMPVEEMHKYCRHVPDNLPTNKPGRVVLYGDFGVPCGGTHVRDIQQVGKVSIPNLKEKKGVIRVSYAVEGIGE